MAAGAYPAAEGRFAAGARMNDFQVLQFRAFREEARALVAEMEAAMQLLERVPHAREPAERIQRSLRALKGASGICDFRHLAELTRDAELLMERVHEGRLTATSELLAAMRCVMDQARLVAEAPEGNLGPDPAVTKLMTPWLWSFLPAGVPGAAGAPSAAASAHGSSLAGPGPMRCLRIRLRPLPNLWRSGVRISQVLAQLRPLGQAIARIDRSRVPPLSRIDPGACYLTWDVLLLTRVEEGPVRDTLRPIEPVCSVEIDRYDHRADPDPSGSPHASMRASAGATTSPAVVSVSIPGPSSGRPPIPRPAAGAFSEPETRADAASGLVDLLDAVRVGLLDASASHPGAAEALSGIAREMERLADDFRPPRAVPAPSDDGPERPSPHTPRE